jgi:hypothetical protein
LKINEIYLNNLLHLNLNKNIVLSMHRVVYLKGETQMTHFPLSGNRNDPDWPEDLTPVNVQDLVEQFLTFNAIPLSDYFDETQMLADKVHAILYDHEDDKIGRIKDLYDEEITRLAKWVEANWETNTHAEWIYKQAMEC